MSVVEYFKPNNLTHISRDTGYRFADSDPMLEYVANAITRSGWDLLYLSEQSGVSTATLRAWMKGRTRRPQNITLTAVLEALGYERVTIKLGAKRWHR